jgi:hypothetical protein
MRALRNLSKTIGSAKNMMGKDNKPKLPKDASKSNQPDLAEARRLLAIVEKSQVPFGESAPLFARIKAQIDAGKSLNVEDYEHLLRLVKIAKDWNKAEESSAMTEPEETLSG